jgi:hypothetical protein
MECALLLGNATSITFVREVSSLFNNVKQRDENLHTRNGR